jgi:hypothetical protein
VQAAIQIEATEKLNLQREQRAHERGRGSTRPSLKRLRELEAENAQQITNHASTTKRFL